MQISKQLLLYTSITILLSSCAIHKYEFPPEIPEWCDDCGFCSGDLIFVRGINTEGMSAAISSATGEYTHEVIVVAQSASFTSVIWVMVSSVWLPHSKKKN